MLDIGPCPGPLIGHVPRDVAGEEGPDWRWLRCQWSSSGWMPCVRSCRVPKSPRWLRLSGCRQSVHSWITRYLAEGLAGLADKSHRPGFCPHQVAGEAEVMVAEMRRQHPKWGAKRIRLELLRRPPGVPVPSERTINRILARQGLMTPRPRKRPRDSY